MSKYADLHTHTTFSDGHDTPSDLVMSAAENDVAVLGVADHDNLGGLPEALVAGKKFGVTIVPGVEISTVFHNHTIHVLGYGIPLVNEDFNVFLEKVFNFRKEAIIKKMEAIGDAFAAQGKKSIDIDDFKKSQGIFFNKEKTAEYLVINGYLPEKEAAYRVVSEARVDLKFRTTSAEAITAIHKAGGLAILSHPFALGTSLRRIDPTPAGQEELLKEMIADGIDGLECYQSEYGPEETSFALSLAEKYHLLASAGSDWHGALCDNVQKAEDLRNYYPEHVGGLKTASSAVAPLLERLGIVVDKV